MYVCLYIFSYYVMSLFFYLLISLFSYVFRLFCSLVISLCLCVGLSFYMDSSLVLFLYLFDSFVISFLLDL